MRLVIDTIEFGSLFTPRFNPISISGYHICLLYTSWANEIVVVDSGSSDRTEEIARSFRARFFLEEWKGFAAQKNSALEKCSCCLLYTSRCV